MKRVFLAHLGALVLFGWSGASRLSAEEQRRLEFHVAGFKAPGYSIEIDGSVVRYRSGPSYKEAGLPWRRVKVDEKGLRHFMGKLQELGVFDWQPEYVCLAFDGVWWRLDASWAGMRVSSHGSNKFPPRFNEVQAATAELTHRKFGISIKDWPECKE